MLAALRRFGVLLVGTAAVSGGFALLVGLAVGAGASRSVSLAWYLVGAAVAVGGFLIGNRGPARLSGGQGWSPISFQGRMLRWATADEQEESINISAVLVALGFVLIVLGVVVDTRYKLF